ncbi:Hypothetical_protein [Hexamita inflata]|uniref:Hypothetical_protein n=1 Tax=Hexamita inflata TaxID=28002 RepID=A0AA86RL24_9EUKA|nr:Hypothetical protein HINF_LOCUS64211 [Hexamita inflata]
MHMKVEMFIDLVKNKFLKIQSQANCKLLVTGMNVTIKFKESQPNKPINSFKVKKMQLIYDWDLKSINKKNKLFDIQNRQGLMTLITKIVDSTITVKCCKKYKIDLAPLLIKGAEFMNKRTGVQLQDVPISQKTKLDESSDSDSDSEDIKEKKHFGFKRKDKDDKTHGFDVI